MNFFYWLKEEKGNQNTIGNQLLTLPLEFSNIKHVDAHLEFNFIQETLFGVNDREPCFGAQLYQSSNKPYPGEWQTV